MPMPPVQQPPKEDIACRICTIRLEQVCYQRAWWFRAFREVLATGIRLFAIAYRIRPDDYKSRSKMCFKCLRFRKNALKRRSRLFNWLDGYLNPLFNRARDSLLTPRELEYARALARRAEDRDFVERESGACLRPSAPSAGGPHEA
ncbi:MAG: hypothetical protein ACYCSH_07065 [Acidithiobacillus sp.]